MANGAAIGGGIVGGVLGLAGGIVGGIQQKRAQTRFRRRQRRAIEEARRFAEESARRVTESDLFQSGQQFIQSTFDDAGGSPLVQDFAKQLRASQAARGIFFGGAPAAAEAGGLAVAAQRLRQSLLPQVQEFATTGERIRQSVLGQESTLRVAAATGAPLPGITPPPFIDVATQALQGTIQGAAGGALLGQELGGGGSAAPAGIEGLQAAAFRRQKAAELDRIRFLSGTEFTDEGRLFSPLRSNPFLIPA